jgi:hypothetical protein
MTMAPQQRRLRRAFAHLSCRPREHCAGKHPENDSSSWQAAGRARALALPNRGTLTLDGRGRLPEAVVRTFHDFGFYVFTGAIGAAELAELQAEVHRVLECAPAGPDASVDGQGRELPPEFGDRSADAAARTGGKDRRGGGTYFGFARPLSDPDGGRGRSPGRMREGVVPKVSEPPSLPPSLPLSFPRRCCAALVLVGQHAYIHRWGGPLALMMQGSPTHVLRHASAFCLFSMPGLRLYGHPKLLAVAASVCGDDFVPSGGGESIQIKLPGLGPSVAWHQDGTTHWQSAGCPPTSLEDATAGKGLCHGFNFMVQAFGCDERNGVWVLPRSHRSTRADIASLRATHGSDVFPEAVPMICAPGDVVICDRNALHCSYPNYSRRLRVTFNFGAHRRYWVLHPAARARHGYDEEMVARRSRVIAIAADARAQHFTREDEGPFVYAPVQHEPTHHLVWDGWDGSCADALNSPMLSL